MRIKIFAVVIALTINSCAGYQSIEKLAQHKEYLGDHFDGYRFAFERFEEHNGKFVVELASWDWDTNRFGYLAADCLYHTDPYVYILETHDDAMKKCKSMTKKLGYVIDYHVWQIVDFLKYYPLNHCIDLLHMGTLQRLSHEMAAQVNLDAVKMIVQRNLLSNTGIILIDNIEQCERAVRYLLSHGYKTLLSGAQLIISR